MDLKLAAELRLANYSELCRKVRSGTGGRPTSDWTGSGLGWANPENTVGNIRTVHEIFRLSRDIYMYL